MNRVFVGLSGGVDSAVSAALLKREGYAVTGVFIKIWQPEFIECTWREDRLDAMRVAAHLDIPFREIDLSEEYKREVVDAMLQNYARGITPNPDIACNRTIKFGHFLDWALREGTNKIATGHYSRIRQQATGNRQQHALLRGVDRSKDQSYFLYQLTHDQLAHTLFPIGDLTKAHVRATARKFRLPNAERPDSQGICFLGDVSMEQFLTRFIPLSRGAVLDMHGTIVGEHGGAAVYTIGQRHGFELIKTDGKEYYVVSIDTKANTITVSQDKRDAARKSLELKDAQWISSPHFPLVAEAQARYRESPAPVKVESNGSRVKVTFAEPHIAAPGQSLVIYDGEKCLGGGVIC